MFKDCVDGEEGGVSGRVHAYCVGGKLLIVDFSVFSPEVGQELSHCLMHNHYCLF